MRRAYRRSLDPYAARALEGLYASTPQQLPFAPSLDIRAFVLRRDRGNLLVYSVAGLGADAAAIADLGGISRHYLNHRHEAMFASGSVDAPVLVHKQERESGGRALPRPRDLLQASCTRRRLRGDPHTRANEGATAYLWDSGEHRSLFTGDSIYLADGEWVATVLESSDREAYVESLELLGELDFDMLVPWAASGGQPFYAVTGKADAKRRIGAILERVRRGQDR